MQEENTKEKKTEGNAEENKKKISVPKIKFRMFLVAQGGSGKEKRFPIPLRFVIILVIAIALIIAAVVSYSHYLSNHILAANVTMEELRTQIDELNVKLDDAKEEYSALEKVNEELQEKVTILSSTINEKLQEEAEREAEIAKTYIPSGFPIQGTATYSVTQLEDGAPVVVFETIEGTSVVATANGTVSSIAGNESVGFIVMVDHGNGYFSVYRNKAVPRVEEGDSVTNQTEIYKILSGKEELGYQIIENNTYIDPMSLMEVYG